MCIIVNWCRPVRRGLVWEVIFSCADLFNTFLCENLPGTRFLILGLLGSTLFCYPQPWRPLSLLLMWVYTCQTGSHRIFGLWLNRRHWLVYFIRSPFDLVVRFTKLNLNLRRRRVVPISRLFHKWSLIQIWEVRGHFRRRIKLVLFLEFPGSRWGCISWVRGHVYEIVPREQFPLMLEQDSLLSSSPLPTFFLHYDLFIAQATLRTSYDLLFRHLFNLGCTRHLLIFQQLALLHGFLRYLQLLSLDHHGLVVTILLIMLHKMLLDNRFVHFALFLGDLVEHLGVLQDRPVKGIVWHLTLRLILPRFTLVNS